MDNPRIEQLEDAMKRIICCADPEKFPEQNFAEALRIARSCFEPHPDFLADKRETCAILILRRILNDLPQVECQNFHHAKKDLHKGFCDCAPWARWSKAVEDARSLCVTP